MFRIGQVLLPNELLHPVILGVGNIKTSGRVQRDSPGIGKAPRFCAGTADDLDRPVVGIEYLDAAVSEFAHILSSPGIHANVVWVAKLAFARPRSAVGAQEN